MGQYVRWQAIIALIGVILLLAYLRSIAIVRTTVIAPDEGGVYREGIVGNIQSLNPLLAEYSRADQDITSLIFEGLTRQTGQGDIEPVLAQGWSVSEDGRVYVFSLRKNVKWSDGSPFTSDDVIFTLELIRAADFPGNPALQEVWQSVSIEQVDDHTVQFILEEPFPAFIDYTTIKILPQHLLKDISAQDLLTAEFNLSPVGSGPFKLLEATDRHILLSQNAYYWGTPSEIEQIAFRFFPNESSLYRAFQNKEIDGISQISPITTLDSSMNLYSAALPRYNVLYFNLQQPETLPFFQDKTVRQALNMLLDRQAIIDETLNGQGVPASGPISSWSWAFNPNQTYPEYNLPEGVALLDQAGWIDSNSDGVRDNNGLALAFKLLVSNDPLQIEAANNIAEQWRNFGIKVTVETVNGELFERLSAKQYEAALVEIELAGDPDLYPLWHQTQIESGQNFAGWDNTPASLALEQGRLSPGREDRIKYYYAFQEIFADEMPALILYYPVYSFIIQDRVKNVQLSTVAIPADRFANIENWYLLTEQVIESTINENFSP